MKSIVVYSRETAFLSAKKKYIFGMAWILSYNEQPPDTIIPG